MKYDFLMPELRRRWWRETALATVLACILLSFSTASAGALPPPDPGPGSPTPPTAVGTTPSDATKPDTSVPPPVDEESPERLNEPIDPELLESLQQSVVGLVTVWEEPEDPWAFFRLGPAPDPDPKAVTLCTGWFDTPTTIVTAGHCVDPAEGRLFLDDQKVTIDPITGDIVVPPPGREPKRTVYAFQPRELAGAVIPAPTIVRVDRFRVGADGDTAKLEIYGLPPAKPIPIAHTTPRLGHAVTAIGFPGLNVDTADGVDVDALINDEKNPAEVLQESRIQPVSTSGTIISRQFRGGVPVYQTNADLAFGISGGPTVNSHGEAYGVNSQMTLTLFEGGNFNIITDTGMLRDFLDHDQHDAGIAQPTAAAQPPTTPPTPAPVKPSDLPAPALPVGTAVAVSAVGGIVVGAGAALWLRRLRGNRSESNSDQRRTPQHRTSRRTTTDDSDE
jgi:hypothetical protein